jgi:hypothetical protein
LISLLEPNSNTLLAFINAQPNDLPLNLFQAQTNEALLTTFAGYHPDSYWEVIGDTNS